MKTKKDISSKQPATESTTLRAYSTLRQAIITGEIQAGEKLKVESLKASLATGASPVREALSLLTSDQLVERRDQRGFRVACVSKEQFEEVLSLRCKLELLALSVSITQGDTHWEEQLVLAHHHMVQSHAQPSDIFEQHHKAFHMALLAACESPILLRFCEQLYDLNIRYRYLAIRSDNYAQRDVAGEHKAILDAAIARDDVAAADLLTSHYRTTGSYLVGLIGWN